MNDSLNQLNSLSIVDGSAVGDSAQEGRFFHLATIFIRIGQPEDFLTMLDSAKPITRLMGVFCLAMTDKNRYQDDITPIFSETTEVQYMPGGCLITHRAVGEIAKMIYDDVAVLGGDPRDSYFN